MSSRAARTPRAGVPLPAGRLAGTFVLPGAVVLLVPSLSGPGAVEASTPRFEGNEVRTTARLTLAAIVLLHGLLHLLGVANALGASVPGLSARMAPGTAVAWLAAAALVIASGLMLVPRAPWWWVVAAAAALVSQAVIVTDWAEAWAGTVPNILLLLAAGYGYASEGPRSLWREYLRRRAAMEPAAGSTVPVSEQELERLPISVATYLRRTGAVGRSRVTAVHLHHRGRIRGGVDRPWMRFTGEQTNTWGSSPTRLFFMRAEMFGLPVDVLHVYDERGATIRGRLLSLIPVVTAAGPEMNRAETVTIFNDLCVLAPAALVDAAVRWGESDDRHALCRFTRGDETVTADLRFDEQGDLIDFISDDRLRASPDGRRFIRQRWSTPLRDYQAFDGRRLAAAGEGRWHAPAPEGEFAYIELEVRSVLYDERITASAEGGAPRQARARTPQR